MFCKNSAIACKECQLVFCFFDVIKIALRFFTTLVTVWRTAFVNRLKCPRSPWMKTQDAWWLQSGLGLCNPVWWWRVGVWRVTGGVPCTTKVTEWQLSHATLSADNGPSGWYFEGLWLQWHQLCHMPLASPGETLTELNSATTQLHNYLKHDKATWRCTVEPLDCSQFGLVLAGVNNPCMDSTQYHPLSNNLL